VLKHSISAPFLQPLSTWARRTLIPVSVSRSAMTANCS
jgi:hypothetical protein